MIDQNKILEAIPDNSFAIVVTTEGVGTVGRVRGMTYSEMGRMFGRAANALDSTVAQLVKQWDPADGAAFLESMIAVGDAPATGRLATADLDPNVEPLKLGPDEIVFDNSADLKRCTFQYLADELVRRGATVTPAASAPDFTNPKRD